jgi:predicted RNase H-like HicB family nuclease
METMTQAYKVVIERDTQGGYVATFPDLVGCQAQARSLKTLMERIQEAMALSPEVGEPAAIPRELAVVAPDGDDY